MISSKKLYFILDQILQSIDEGVHVVDNKGKTILYNQAMAELEGMKLEEVIGESLLDVFPSLNDETSTLLKVLETQKPIVDQVQTYFNNHSKKITTINTTFPLYQEGEKIGAVEIAKDITKIKNLSDQVLTLQQQLIKPSPPYKSEIKRYTFENLIGKSHIFIEAVQLARRAANTSSSVLIYGETGTGKELFAQSIHYHSNRKKKPFLAENCAAFPESLLEGILFGTIKGGFTGAIDRPGIFEQANGGTILLDEINSMGLQLQGKLLRVLQEGYVRRIGGTKNIPIDVRIIATTNEDPLKAIKEYRLRKDLYFRLNVVNIQLPTLAERPEDIVLLTQNFINKYNERLDKDVWMVSEFMKERFELYSWPGNVRELENVVEGAMNMVQDEHILKQEHFPMYLTSEMKRNKGNIGAKQFAGLPLDSRQSLDEILNDIEMQMIIYAMSESKGNISQTARKLGIKRQTLQHKLKKHKRKEV
ncbi:sigma54 specific transcriptional regulator, Fis family [Alkaliphilus metalliredigens QYMF]|uniref:Sigma54 specific transcriptional regulator, Fis family n=1 Tax=Alkaliphilus metalliredigens (strain QYMF) TaxID=293826 RepID=A6TQQ2_ALKMQ|nr:sigma-54-dependent Fis family transcriptional regulator [Alkaliphilus metalliredigens]ABR48520.1 sigma54 specific transcriptional regulator, Fis family [Alkaliphilus metalliredigens QYMF]